MKKIISKIEAAQSIAILAHDSEDADALGSSFAMRLVLSEMGKDAFCVLSDTPERHLEFMKGEFEVFSGEAKNVDLCLCLDCGDIKRIGKRRAIFDSAKDTASIDHHETNDFFANANYVDAASPATGEILYELFLEMGAKITQEIAENLFAAISSDTGSFKYSNVRPRTLEITAELLKTGIDHAEIARNLFDTEPLDILKLKGYIMGSVEQYAKGRLMIVTATQKLLADFGVDERDTGDIVNIARSVKGCEIAVSMRDTGEKIKLSFRSNGRFQVSELAAKFGGGGHAMAAGAAVSVKSLDEVKSEVIKVCEDILNG